MSHAKQLHHRRYLNDYLEIINREGLPGNVKTDLCRTVQDTVIATRETASRCACVQTAVPSRLQSVYSMVRLLDVL